MEIKKFCLAASLAHQTEGIYSPKNWEREREGGLIFVERDKNGIFNLLAKWGILLLFYLLDF